MTTENKDTKKRPIDIARENLKLLSEEVLDLVQDGMFFTINDAIVETLYKNDTHRIFKSYRQWKNEGFQVRKGEKAFLLWARPKEIQRPIEEGKTAEEMEDMMKYFPIAYLFSNAQVDEMEGAKIEPGETAQAAPEHQPLKPVKISLEPLEY